MAASSISIKTSLVCLALISLLVINHVDAQQQTQGVLKKHRFTIPGKHTAHPLFGLGHGHEHAKSKAGKIGKTGKGVLLKVGREVSMGKSKLNHGVVDGGRKSIAVELKNKH